MSAVLKVNSLCKSYPGFALQDVSFTLERGGITGFLGRNGAGKTTTLKSLLQLVRPDSGEISFFGLPFAGNETAIKQKIGFAAGGFPFYSLKKLKIITEVTRRFYENWDDAVYRSLLERFALDETKTPKELSEGMKVKYSLALALSHHAELLILDEPTSGLDPVSREEILELFLALQDEGATILFSTHITADLEKSADNILYLRRGAVLADEPLDAFLSRWRLASFAQQPDDPRLIGLSRGKRSWTALLPAGADASGAALSVPSLDQIMICLEKEERS